MRLRVNTRRRVCSPMRVQLYTSQKRNIRRETKHVPLRVDRIDHDKTLAVLIVRRRNAAHSLKTSGLSNGNKITSRMLVVFVSIIHRRSIPIPKPPVGGMA